MCTFFRGYRWGFRPICEGKDGSGCRTFPSRVSDSQDIRLFSSWSLGRISPFEWLKNYPKNKKFTGILEYQGKWSELYFALIDVVEIFSDAIFTSLLDRGPGIVGWHPCDRLDWAHCPDFEGWSRLCDNFSELFGTDVHSEVDSEFFGPLFDNSLDGCHLVLKNQNTGRWFLIKVQSSAEMRSLNQNWEMTFRFAFLLAWSLPYILKLYLNSLSKNFWDVFSWCLFRFWAFLDWTVWSW